MLIDGRWLGHGPTRARLSENYLRDRGVPASNALLEFGVKWIEALQLSLGIRDFRCAGVRK